ncbi:hypothetical protein CR513_07494, partial [Mucuna pruriens]
MLNGTNFKVRKKVVEKFIPTPKNLEERFRDLFLIVKSVRKFIEEIEQFFTKNEKMEMSNLLAKLISMKYKCK